MARFDVNLAYFVLCDILISLFNQNALWENMINNGRGQADIKQNISYLIQKAAKIRDPNDQVPHLTQDTTSESDNNTIKHQFCITIYGKQDGFNFEVVNFPFLDGNLLAPLLTKVFIFHSLLVSNFNDRNQILTA